MNEGSVAVVIGDSADPHVAAVVARLHRPLVLDVVSLASRRYCLHDGRLSIGDDNGSVELPNQSRGWIRRLAPADWQRGVVIESHDAAVKTAWLTLLTSVIRTCGVEWLTTLDPLIVAENKLVQNSIARQIGIPTPTTMVTNCPEKATDTLGSAIIIKPLGPGHYFDGDEPYVVFATPTTSDSPELHSLTVVPFIVQAQVPAKAHLRIVTVRNELWAAQLDAASYPVDWRSDRSAHRSFSPSKLPTDVSRGALEVANKLCLGYSSQDWVLNDEGAYLLDVNPAGQWLFLPTELSVPITSAIADWLNGG